MLWSTLNLRGKYRLFFLYLPQLIIHGDADVIVPVQHAQDLYQAMSGDKTLWIIEGGDHISAFGLHRQEYRPRLLSYLADKLRR